MNRRTPLYQQHLEAGAKIVDFAGWDMPLHYGSQIAEHRMVREGAGVFDVSHMTIVDVDGPDAGRFLRYLLANDVERLKEAGRALYSAMLNESGGVVDDLIVYRMNEGYRLVVNCGTREKDLAWIRQHAAGYDLEVTERPELAILAANGPLSVEKTQAALRKTGSRLADAVPELSNFQGSEDGDEFIARTGYTGERGLECMLPAERAPALWQAMMAQQISPVGLGARDTLRLEAGMNLYGHDMDEETSPLAANMGQTISWKPAERDFIGRAAVEADRKAQERGELPQLCGLVMEDRGVLREGQPVICQTGTGQAEGIITSGTFSPTLKHSIALARIPPDTRSCQVDLRGKLSPLRIVKPGFVRMGRKII